MDENLKFVDFMKYCPICEYWKKPQGEEPCNSCMETGAREGTAVPTNYKEK